MSQLTRINLTIPCVSLRQLVPTAFQRHLSSTYSTTKMQFNLYEYCHKFEHLEGIANKTNLQLLSDNTQQI